MIGFSDYLSGPVHENKHQLLEQRHEQFWTRRASRPAPGAACTARERGPLVELQSGDARGPHSDTPFDCHSFACSAVGPIELPLMAEISACEDPQFLSFANGAVKRDFSPKKTDVKSWVYKFST